VGPDREGTTPGAENLPLHWVFWEAETEERGCLLIVHGLGEHSGRYASFAGFLRQNAFSVLAFDLRGHGLSGGRRGDVDAFPRFVEDLVVMEGVMDGLTEAPSFLLGHSLGGLVALARLEVGSGHYAGVVLSAPWLATPLPLWLRTVARTLSWIVPGLQLPASLGPERLTADPEVMRELREDPLVHTRITTRLFREAERVQERIRGRSSLRAPPLLFLLPGEDRVVDGEVAAAFAERIRGTEVTVEDLPGRRHEPLNDLGRSEVYRLVAAWIRDRTDLPGKPG
jgi:alpha-beta hydrolase superfamily lysophospholipase